MNLESRMAFAVEVSHSVHAAGVLSARVGVALVYVKAGVADQVVPGRSAALVRADVLLRFLTFIYHTQVLKNILRYIERFSRYRFFFLALNNLSIKYSSLNTLQFEYIYKVFG